MTKAVRIAAAIAALVVGGWGFLQLLGAQGSHHREVLTPTTPSDVADPKARPKRITSDALKAVLTEPRVASRCGDGKKQGREQCDDGNLDPFDGCVSCKEAPVVEMTCDECITKYPELEEYNRKVCSADAQCTKIRDCALKTGCFKLDFPGACYCGFDTTINDCARQPAFTPHGPCLEEFMAASGDDHPQHPDPLRRQFDLAYPVGEAFLLIDELSRKCSRACGFEHLKPLN